MRHDRNERSRNSDFRESKSEYHVHWEKGVMPTPKVSNKYYTAAETRARIKRDNELNGIRGHVDSASQLGDPLLKSEFTKSQIIFPVILLVSAIIAVAVTIIGSVGA